MASSPPPPPPVIGGRYRIVRRLATGGMAEVWLAIDQTLSREVAIKVLKPHLAKDPLVAERFRREAKSAASLSHPNIVAVFDTIDGEGKLAVVMQYVPGKSLREILDERSVLTAEMVIRIARSVSGALDHAHQKQLVHRDVKPGNIMLTPDGQVLLTDFGIAKATSETSDDLTRDDVMMGTAKYISPEQVKGHKLDGRADLYSLGLVLYECLAGKVPFSATSDVEMALARIQRDPTPLGRFAPSAAPGLIELIHRLLAREPGNRPASGTAIDRALDTVVASMRRGSLDPTPGGSATPSPANTPASGSAGVAGAGIGHAGGGGSSAARVATPTNGVDRHGRPAKRFQQRLTMPTLVAAGLVLAALIVGGILWASLNDQDGNALPNDTVVTTPDTSPITSPITQVAATTIVEPPTPLALNRLRVYDVNGDLEENDDQLDRALDQDPTSAWRTVCYEDKYLGGKGGVGIVVELAGNSAGTLDVTFGDKPWAIDVFLAAGDTFPATLAAWGAPVAEAHSTTELNASFSLAPRAADYALVWMHELAVADSGCSGGKPYRGAIAEVTVTPT